MVKSIVLTNKDTKDYEKIFGNRFNMLAKALQKNVGITIYHGEDLPVGFDSDGTDLHVFVWASNKTDDMYYSENDTAFGKKFCNDALFVPTEGLVRFKDGDTVLAEYDQANNVLSFLYDIWEYESQDEIDLFNTILNMFIEHVIGSMDEYTKKLEEAVRIEKEESIRKAVENLMATIETDKRNLMDKAQTAERSLADYMNKIKQLSMNIISIELQLDGMKSGADGIREKLLKEIEAMRNNKKIEDIFFNEKGNLVFDTQELFTKVKCKDGVIRRYRMGRFRVEVRLGNGKVYFFNRDIENVRRSVWGECHHPHVNESGVGCLGNASTLIVECITTREWAVLADVLINYLESINTDDSAGRNFVNWDEVDTEGKAVTNRYITSETVDDKTNRNYQKAMIKRVKEGRYVAGIEYKEVK